jgi:hypothetical protein
MCTPCSHTCRYIRPSRLPVLDSLLGVAQADCASEPVLVDAEMVCTAQLADSICATLLSVYDGADYNCLQQSQRPAEHVIMGITATHLKGLKDD